MKTIILFFLLVSINFAQSKLEILFDSGVTFSPSDLSGLDIWIDPAVEYCNGTPPEYDNITDRSGNGNDMTFYQQASWYADSLNGNPAIYFDGVNDYMATADSLGYKFTVFLVVKAYQNTGSGRVIGNGTDSRGIYTGATNYALYVDNSITTIGAWANWAIITWQVVGVNALTYYNGGNLKTGTMVGSASTPTTNIGQDSTPQKCIVAEYIKYGRDLSVSEIDQVNTYLNTKYGIY